VVFFPFQNSYFCSKLFVHPHPKNTPGGFEKLTPNPLLFFAAFLPLMGLLTLKDFRFSGCFVPDDFQIMPLFLVAPLANRHVS